MSETVINTILSELKKQKKETVDEPVVDERVSKITKSITVESFSKEFIDTFTIYINDIEHIASIIQITTTHLSVLNVGTSLTALEFMDLFHKIYTEVNAINTNISVKLQVGDLVDICCIIIQLALALLISTDNEFNTALEILQSTAKLIKFTMSMPLKTQSINCFSCCRL